MKKTFKAFTLVELIVVITILAVLGTIAFVSLQGYSINARDSVRTADLKNIEKLLVIFYTKTGMYPSPESPVNITLSGTTILKQGTFGNEIATILNLSKTPTDPIDLKKYTYSTNSSNTKMQLLGFLEGGNTLGQNILPKTYATDYTNRFPKTTGDSLGILLDANNNPIQENQILVSSGLELSITTTSYKAILQKNTFTGSSQIIGTGSQLTFLDNPYKSCYTILQSGLGKTDGLYEINPTGNLPFQVYCDMTTDGGGWILVASVVNHSSFWSPGTYNSYNSARVIDIGIPSPTTDYVMQLGKWKTLLANGGVNSWFRLKVRRIDNDTDVTLGFLKGLQMKDNGGFINANAAYDRNMTSKNAVSSCIIQYTSDFNNVVVFNYFQTGDLACTGNIGWNGYCGYPSLGHSGDYAGSGMDRFVHACSIDDNYYCSTDNTTGTGTSYCYYKRKWYWIK